MMSEGMEEGIKQHAAMQSNIGLFLMQNAIFILFTQPSLKLWLESSLTPIVRTLQAGTFPPLSSSQWSHLSQAPPTTTAPQPVEQLHQPLLPPMTATDPGAQGVGTDSTHIWDSPDQSSCCHHASHPKREGEST